MPAFQKPCTFDLENQYDLNLFSGFGIFFEFKHYKPKKKIVSTKCWSFMERDEVKEGDIAIELYVFF